MSKPNQASGQIRSFAQIGKFEPPSDRNLRFELLALCKGNVVRAREALSFIQKGGEAEGRIRRRIVEICPLPIDGPQQWEAALKFLEGEDA